MSDYPDNSHSSREKNEKKLDKVVAGHAKTRKKTKAEKLAGMLSPGDTANIGYEILTDVVVPGFKNAVADVVSIMLFGEAGRIGGRKKNGSKVSYQRYYDDRRDDRREYGRPRSSGGFEYDDIIFETRGDADLVLDQMESAIATYGIVSVADLYDLAGITCRSYTANKYGWTDIRNAKAVRTHDGYILQLPRTVQIN